MSYEGEVYKLAVGDCVFIDCQKAYSHSTGYPYNADENCDEDLWSLQWCHFYAPSLSNVYKKYRERGGRPVFHPENVILFTDLLTEHHYKVLGKIRFPFCRNRDSVKNGILIYGL